MDKKRLKNLIVTAAVIYTVNGYAQDKENLLDPVTVTANLQPTNASKTGRDITVISGEQFSKLPVHSIDELLRYVPGVEIQQRGPMGSQSDIVLRGATFGQVLVLLDGVRLNDPNTGHFTSYIPVAPTEIDRIEILKGASSALYGSEAVGGVINIITKSFSAKRDAVLHEVAAEAAIGEYNTSNIVLGANLQNSKTAISGGLLSNNSEGQPQRGARGYFNNHTASLSVHQILSNHWSLALRSAFDSRRFSAQNFYTSFVSDTAEEQVRSFWNQANLTYRNANNAVSFDAGYRQTKDRYAYNSAAGPNENTSGLLQSALVWQHRINSASTLILGSQFQHKSIRSNDRGDHQLNQAAGFALLNQKLLRNLDLVPALRVDYDEKAGTELVPQLNASYHLDHLQLRASAGKTIRQADFTERFNNYNKTFVAAGSIGNPDLDAETSFSYEAGGDLYFNRMVKLSATAFRRHQKNVIDWINTAYSEMPRKENLSPTGTYALATNVAEVKTTGVEADIQFTKAISPEQSVWATLGLTWLDTKTSEAAASFYIASHAKFLASLSLNYQWKRWSLNAAAVYKVRDPVQATAIDVKLDLHCFMFNAKADYRIIQNKLSAFFEGDDLLNDHCRDLVNALRPSRWLTGGVRLSIR